MVGGEIESSGSAAWKVDNASKRGESNKRVSNAKLRAIGWTPRYPTFAEAMEKKHSAKLRRGYFDAISLIGYQLSDALLGKVDRPLRRTMP